MKQLFLNATIAFMSLAFCLAIAERLLASSNFSFHLYPKEVHFGYPNPTEIQENFEPHTEYSWVRKDYETQLTQAREAERLIVFLGDSTTQWGQYHQNLMVLPNGRRELRDLTGVSLGVGGWSSHQGKLQFEQDIIELRPLAAVVLFGWNDHWLAHEASDSEATFSRSNFYVKLNESRLVQLLAKTYVKSTRTGNRPLRVSISEFKENHRTIAKQATEAGIALIIATAPSNHQDGSEPTYLAPNWISNLNDLVPLHGSYAEALRAVVTELDIPLCDLERIIREDVSPITRKSLFADDGIHLTAAGDTFVAKQLYRCFDEEGISRRLQTNRNDI